MIITFTTFLYILQKKYICYDLATPRATPSKRSWMESARTTRKPRAIATIPSSAPRSTSPWLCPWPVVWRSQEIFESNCGAPDPLALESGVQKQASQGTWLGLRKTGKCKGMNFTPHLLTFRPLWVVRTWPGGGGEPPRASRSWGSRRERGSPPRANQSRGSCRILASWGTPGDDSCQNILFKVGNNLVDIRQHVSEARREDDSSSKHGETREKSHHGRRLWTKSSGRNIFFCAKVLLALLFQMLSKYFNTESTWTLFLCQRPADFRSGAANPSEHQGEGERRPGGGEGVQRHHEYCKSINLYFCTFVFLYFLCVLKKRSAHTTLGEVAQLWSWGWHWCWGLQKLLSVCRFGRQTKLYNYQMLPTRRNRSSWRGFAAKYSAGLVLTIAEKLFVLKHGLLSCNWSSSAAREPLRLKVWQSS